MCVCVCGVCAKKWSSTRHRTTKHARAPFPPHQPTTDAAAELSSLEATLRQPDAVLEPGVLAVLRRYVAAGGHPATVVELLADSYVGHAAAAELAVAWDKLLDVGNSGGKAGGAAAPAVAPAPPPTEADHLHTLAAARFDPAAFAGVFTRGGGGPPPWLHALVADRAGRALFYQLSSRHSNCLLLSYAVQRALRAAPAPDEVAAAGAALAGHCSVFASLAASALARVPQARAGELVPLAADLSADLCRAQHAYITAAAMLARLGGEGGKDGDGGDAPSPPTCARYRRLAQELQAAAAAAHGAPVWQMARWLLPVDAGAGADAAAAAVAALAAADGSSAGGSASDGDAAVSELSRMYRAPAAAAGDGGWGAGGTGDASTPPPIPPLSVLRQPAVFERLISRLFTPGRAAAVDATDAAALLATAAAAVDERASGGGLDAADVPGAAAAIAGARALAHGAATGARFDAAAAAAAASAARVGAAAAGVLHTARVCLGDPDWWLSSLGGGGGGVPPLVSALAAVLPAAPSLGRAAVAVVEAGLRGAGNARPDAARALADVLVAVIVGAGGGGDADSSGGSDTVVRDGLAASQRWAASADPSLVRHLVRRLLAAVGPPYSPEFGGAVVRLLAASGVRSRRGATSTASATRSDGPDADTLRAFAGAVAVLPFDPPLSAREAGLLAELKAERVF